MAKGPIVQGIMLRFCHIQWFKHLCYRFVYIYRRRRFDTVFSIEVRWNGFSKWFQNQTSDTDKEVVWHNKGWRPKITRAAPRFFRFSFSFFLEKSSIECKKSCFLLIACRKNKTIKSSWTNKVHLNLDKWKMNCGNRAIDQNCNELKRKRSNWIGSTPIVWPYKTKQHDCLCRCSIEIV